MSETHKDESSSVEDKWSELGQQVGTLLGQLLAGAERFGERVSNESQTWSEAPSSREQPQDAVQEPLLREPSKEPRQGRSQESLVTAFSQAGEEFRTTAKQVAERWSNSLAENSLDSTASNESVEGASISNPIIPGRVRKIGGAATESTAGLNMGDLGEQPATANDQGTKGHDATHRIAQLAEIFHSDLGLSDLSDGEFDALKTLLGKQYRDIREFQDSK